MLIPPESGLTAVGSLTSSASRNVDSECAAERTGLGFGLGLGVGVGVGEGEGEGDDDKGISAGGAGEGSF